MIGPQGQRLIELRGPVFAILPRPGVHQVKAEVIKGAAGQFQCRQRLVDAVLSPQRQQGIGAQALDPQRQAIDPGGPVAGEAVCIGAGRVGL